MAPGPSKLDWLALLFLGGLALMLLGAATYLSRSPYPLPAGLFAAGTIALLLFAFFSKSPD